MAAMYEPAAAEYYDPVLHPTCANFGELSARFLEERALLGVPDKGRLLEVGAGRSVVAKMMERNGRELRALTLLDESEGMLSHSRPWVEKGARPLVGDAAATGLPDETYDRIVAPLGDPYNDARFWAEVRRLLVRGGLCLFTTPAPHWAERFRTRDGQSEAEMTLASGTMLRLRSNVLPVDAQTRLIESAGLVVTEFVGLAPKGLTGPVSVKLMLDDATRLLPSIYGYVALKP